MKYRKKPVVIEAVRLGWDTWNEMCEFAGVGRLEHGAPQGGWWSVEGGFTEFAVGDHSDMALAIPTLEGVMVAVEGDYVIRGIQGELYPCKPDIFAATYEPAEGVS